MSMNTNTVIKLKCMNVNTCHVLKIVYIVSIVLNLYIINRLAGKTYPPSQKNYERSCSKKSNAS